MNKDQQKTEWDEILGKLRNGAEKAFAGQSNNYKQKLVYTLLGTIKTSERTEFQWKLLRVLNSRREKAKDLIDDFKMEEVQKEMRTKRFEDIAYAIVMGIMSTYSGEEG